MNGLSKLGPKAEKTEPMKPAAEPKEPKTEAKKHEGEGEVVHELHDHGDGSFHTVSGGEKTDHPDGHHALAHIAHKAMGGGRHFHAHHDGMSMHSHGISDSGEHSETREHDSPEDMHAAMDEAMGGEGGGGEQAAAAPEEEPTLGGFRG